MGGIIRAEVEDGLEVHWPAREGPLGNVVAMSSTCNAEGFCQQATAEWRGSSYLAGGDSLEDELQVDEIVDLVGRVL